MPAKHKYFFYRDMGVTIESLPPFTEQMEEDGGELVQMVIQNVPVAPANSGLLVPGATPRAPQMAQVFLLYARCPLHAWPKVLDAMKKRTPEGVELKAPEPPPLPPNARQFPGNRNVN